MQVQSNSYYQAYQNYEITLEEALFFEREVAFQAEYPKELDPKKGLSNKEIVKIVLLSTVLLPIGLLIVVKKISCWALWAFANFLARTIQKNPTRNLVNSAILPSIGDSNSFWIEPNMVRKKLRTPDGVDLETIMVWNKQEDAQQFADSKESNLVCKNNWVIFHLPNAATFSQILSEAQKWVRNYNFNILFYNYRGVGDSGKKFDLKTHKVTRIEPKTQKDLMLDGVTAYQFLISHNVSPEKICSVGYSLGGGVAAQVASIYPTSICNIKSFISLSKVCEGFLTPETKSKVWNFIGSGLAKFAGWIVSGVLNEANWNLNTGEIWPKLKTHKWIVTGAKDEIINYPARLGIYLKEKGLLSSGEEMILENDYHGDSGLSDHSERANDFHKKHFSVIFPEAS